MVQTPVPAPSGLTSSDGPPPPGGTSSALADATPRAPHARQALHLHAAQLPPGTELGGYVVEEPLGEGGMGHVYRAVDVRLDRPVALKVLSTNRLDIDDAQESRARFLREARALARVEHDNVVRVFASGEDGDRAWMALEVIEGEPLSSVCEGEPLDEESALTIAAQIARGLHAVHAMGVVHRDVKPSNVLLTDDAVVKLIDFGVAQLDDGGAPGGGFTTRAGVVVGTPHFMSPEQARGASVDARSDAWGLGATLYALLSGRPPFYAADDEADLDILARVVRDPIPPLAGVSADTTRLLTALLAKRADERPADLAGVAVALEDIAHRLADGTLTSPAPALIAAPDAAAPPPESSGPESLAVDTATPGRSPLVLAVPVVVLVALVAAGVAVVGPAWRGLDDPPPGPPPHTTTTTSSPTMTMTTTTPTVVLAPTTTSTAPTASADTGDTESIDDPASVLAAEARAAAETPEAQAEAITADDAGRVVLARLAQADDEVSWEVLRLAARRPQVGRLVIDAVVQAGDGTGGAGETVDARLAALAASRPAKGAAMALLDVFDTRRNDVSLRVARQLAADHPDAAVRRRARAVADSIFKVD